MYPSSTSLPTMGESRNWRHSWNEPIQLYARGMNDEHRRVQGGRKKGLGQF